MWYKILQYLIWKLWSVVFWCQKLKGVVTVLFCAMSSWKLTFCMKIWPKSPCPPDSAHCVLLGFRQKTLLCKINLLGQFRVLQALVSVDKPEHVPPFCSITDLDLDLVCVPLPQLLEHDEYPLQLPQRQFTESCTELWWLQNKEN